MRDEKIRIFNVLWSSHNGGPSPDGNIRTELFLSGCSRAANGEPCEECFNPDLWNKDVYVAYESPEDIFKKIKRYAPNKYITIVGGEPLDQLEGLSKLCELLKRDEFHITVFTSFTLPEIQEKFRDKDAYLDRLFSNIDILIDGKYDKNEHIPTKDSITAFSTSVGSGNQVIWDFNRWNNFSQETLTGYYARDIMDIYVRKDNRLIYIYKDNASELSKLFTRPGGD